MSFAMAYPALIIRPAHVGYELVFRDIEPGNVSVVFDVALKTNEIEEVTVAAKVKFRTRDINLFWKTILGKPPSKRTIHAVNPEDVRMND